MTYEPCKGSASVNGQCRAALRGSESWGDGNRGAEHAPQCSTMPPAPFAVDEGGRAKPEEGGHDLEQKQDAGEDVCHVRWAWVWAGWKDDGGGFAVVVCGRLEFCLDGGRFVSFMGGRAHFVW
jgi:hypothetical protein